VSDQQEPWLRGTHTDIPAVIRGVVHALELSREDIDAACEPLTDEQIHVRPGEVASLAFHLGHIVGSLDRLLTYAEGRQLSSKQLAILKAEQEARGSRAELLDTFHRGVDSALLRIRRFAGADMEQPRQVGRKALPTTVGGLLVHCADHTLRHTGQAVTTAKLVSAGRT
jgi:uncharacterized damage-inducible protein DinB